MSSTTSRGTPTRRDLESPARRRDRGHRRLSLEGLPARQPGADAHARRRRVSPPFPPARPPEALRPHPLLRLPCLAVPYPAARAVSSCLGRRVGAATRT